jgi:hypothetical protein
VTGGDAVVERGDIAAVACAVGQREPLVPLQDRRHVGRADGVHAASGVELQPTRRGKPSDGLQPPDEVGEHERLQRRRPGQITGPHHSRESSQDGSPHRRAGVGKLSAGGKVVVEERARPVLRPAQVLTAHQHNGSVGTPRGEHSVEFHPDTGRDLREQDHDELGAQNQLDGGVPPARGVDVERGRPNPVIAGQRGVQLGRDWLRLRRLDSTVALSHPEF